MSLCKNQIKKSDNLFSFFQVSSWVQRNVFLYVKQHLGPFLDFRSKSQYFDMLKDFGQLAPFVFKGEKPMEVGLAVDL